MIKIGLIGDPHATPAPLHEALSIFRNENVDEIWCTGDIAGYGSRLDETVALLIDSGCKAIKGNHDSWHLQAHTDQATERTNRYLENLATVVATTIEGKSVYMVHASPPLSDVDGIKLLDIKGRILPNEASQWSARLADFKYDVLIVGHTHQVFAERLANTLVINPGSCNFNHSCAILKFPALTCQWFGLSGKTPVKAWNWGLYFNTPA